MTTRWFSSSRRDIVCFFVILFILIVIAVTVAVHLLGSHSDGTGRDDASNARSGSGSPGWQSQDFTTFRPRVSFLPTTVVSTGQPGVGVLVESEPVPPYETPPNDTSPGGSGGQDDKVKFVLRYQRDLNK
ncbi:hypothetical protein ZHAS_00007044 [Anopheles sinensis]|uniref:Uncharacterized protein n=1 Tax=Anopheles sinensis TaxID=74873 RepID=A0A084VNR1_ANOSI|nr:hypothetical protein ZHAS_00007044 [Anopheles sinensis]